MPKRMLIDSSHPEETRVVVLDGNRVEEFDFEAASKRPLKGNIYLAKVTRVEPSLQAAFVEYGGNRQGFLAFSEIHPDYYQIPVADRLAILEAQTQRMMAEEDFDTVEIATVPAQSSPVIEGEHPDDHAEHHEHETLHVHNGVEHAHDEDEPHDHDHDDHKERTQDEVHENVGSERASHPDDAALESLEAAAVASIAGTGDVEHVETALEVYEAAPLQTIPSTDEAAPYESGSSGATQENEPSETAPQMPSLVQAESTGAPSVYERRGPRQNDRHDRPRPPRRRQYKIQEVIKRRQIMLVQVVKEERGNKGASLTTFLSLAGRYCVLMPNTPRGGGISRKITNAADRKRLKSAAQSLELPEGMGLIIRTAGANRTKLEIKRDYEYLLRLWDTVRELTLKSNAPALVYEEGSLIKRAIRDLYSKDISEVVVDGENGYRDAKDFMRMLMPSHAKNVKLYKEALPLFQRFQVESQLDAMFSPVVNLRSGGYIVINQTEALVSIDVNSGKATREHSIEETAYKTNLEAADEIARQLRLRDLAGLIVIDFIDMEDSKNDRNVEKRLHNAVRGDRARIQIGKISQFGLLEMSRQRLRAGVLAGSTVTCPHCNGQGIIRSTESAALRLLRALDEEGQRQPAANVTVRAPEDVTIYTLNQKRREIFRIEEAYDLAITFDPQTNMMGGSFEIERTGVRIPSPRPKALPVSVEAGFQEAEEEAPETDVTIVEAPSEPAAQTSAPAPERMDQANGEAHGEGRGRKRRRRRRGGRGRGGPQQQQGTEFELESRAADSEAAPDMTEGEGPIGEDEDHDEEAGPEEEAREAQPSEGRPLSPMGEGGEKRRRRRRRGRRGRRRDGEFGHTPGETGPRIPAEAPLGGAPAYASPVTQEGPAAPNAESSPLWSLTDQTSAAPELAPEPIVEPEVPPMEAINPVVEPRPRPVDLEETPVIAPVEASSSNEPPREARKGWWQRRFKG